MCKLCWLGPNDFGKVQISLLWTDFYNLDLSKMIWIRAKQIGDVQNDWYVLDPQKDKALVLGIKAELVESKILSRKVAQVLW